MLKTKKQGAFRFGRRSWRCFPQAREHSIEVSITHKKICVLDLA